MADKGPDPAQREPHGRAEVDPLPRADARGPLPLPAAERPLAEVPAQPADESFLVEQPDNASPSETQVEGFYSWAKAETQTILAMRKVGVKEIMQKYHDYLKEQERQGYIVTATIKFNWLLRFNSVEKLLRDMKDLSPLKMWLDARNKKKQEQEKKKKAKENEQAAVNPEQVDVSGQTLANTGPAAEWAWDESQGAWYGQDTWNEEGPDYGYVEQLEAENQRLEGENLRLNDQKRRLENSQTEVLKDVVRKDKENHDHLRDARDEAKKLRSEVLCAEETARRAVADKAEAITTARAWMHWGQEREAEVHKCNARYVAELERRLHAEKVLAELRARCL